MAKDCSFGKMEPNTRATGSTAELMAQELFIMPTVTSIVDYFPKTKLMALVFIPTKQANSTKVNG